MRFGFCLAFLLFFSSFVPALSLPFDTAAVGRAQGSSFEGLDASLDAKDVEVQGADYYSGKYIGPLSIYSSTEQEKTASVLQGAYGAQNVESRGQGQWGFSDATNSRTPKDRALVLQSTGVVMEGKVRAFDGKSSPEPFAGSLGANQANMATPVSAIPLDLAIAGGNLVVADVDYAGTYLPTMNSNESFSSQLAGKAGALIATNGKANPALVKAIVCSLALQDYRYPGREYYTFDSLGDRLRNAKNNLSEFGGGTDSLTSDYSLYGAPYTKVIGQKLSSEELKRICGDFAKYNTLPFAQSLSVQSEGNPGFITKSVSVDFSDYRIIEEGGVQLIDVNNAMQRLEEGKPVLPQALFELEFPLGTLISEVRLASKSNPITLDLNALPSVASERFAERLCGSNTGEVEFSHSTIYTEGSQVLAVKIIPVEILDCSKGTFRLYRDIELEADYNPYSPVLIKGIASKQEVFPGENFDVNIVLEGIVPQPVSGKIVVLDGNEVIAQQEVSLLAGEEKNSVLSIKAGDKEGFYDYDVVFEQDGEAKTKSNFKARAEKLGVKLEFRGSKRIIAGEVTGSDWGLKIENDAVKIWPDYRYSGSTLYTHARSSNTLADFSRSTVAFTLTSKPDRRFSVNDLPLVLKLGNGFVESRKRQPRNADTPEVLMKVIPNEIYFDMENDHTVKWRAGPFGEWNYISVDGWDTTKLGLGVRVESHAQFGAQHPNRAFATHAWISFALTDDVGRSGSHSNVFYYETTELDSQNDRDGDFESTAQIDVQELSWEHLASARGTAVVDVLFENRGSMEIETSGKYSVRDENGNIVAEGDLRETIQPGKTSKSIRLSKLARPDAHYSMALLENYDNKSKVVTASFSGNNAPEITAPAFIRADAFDTVVLDYKVEDRDNDRLGISVSEPFTVQKNTWTTTDKDIGARGVTITASDGFETATKTVMIEVGEPRIECSFDTDCGSTVVVEPRVCENGRLFAEERMPVCVNPGTFTAKCSSVDVNRVYGYCATVSEFTDGNSSTIARFDGAGEKTAYIKLPRKAKVNSASVGLNGAPGRTMCFDIMRDYDSARTTAEMHRFANGTSFLGLPLHGEFLAASNEISSDRLDGHPSLNFSIGGPGVAARIAIVVGASTGAGPSAYINGILSCENSITTWSGNLIQRQGYTTSWIESGFQNPQSTDKLNDFCSLGPGRKTITFDTYNTGAYHWIKGQSSFPDQYPAFRFYMGRFQSPTEVYLPDTEIMAKSARLATQEDLRGQTIGYFVTFDGRNWLEIRNNADAVTVPFSGVGGKFGWKAVLTTSDAGKTPRISGGSVCVDTAGIPGGARLIAGKTEFGLGSLSGKTGIDITQAVNSYLASLEWADVNVDVPIRLIAGSGGIIELSGISYDFDAESNTSPMITSIAEQFASSEEPFTLQVNATDLEGDKLSFSDDSGLFEINAETGIISFTPSKEDVGEHMVTVYASDGNYTISQKFRLTIAKINHAPIITQTQPQTAFAGTEYTLQVEASDPDNDTLRYSDDTGLFDINSETGLIKFMPRKESMGWHTITISVSDGDLNSQQKFGLRIGKKSTPHALAISSYKSRINEGETVVLEAVALGFDGNITYSIDSNRFRQNHNKFYWGTNSESAGNYNFTITATDGDDIISSKLSITIHNKNFPPVLEVSLDRNVLTIDDEVVVRVKATDPDNDKLSFTSEVDALVFDGKNTFKMLTSPEMLGDHNIGITVSDGIQSVTKFVALKITYWEGMEPCFDSDNGIWYYEQGFVQNRLENGLKHYDTCRLRAETAPNNWIYTPVEECTGPLCNLQERYCSGPTISSITQYCKHGCKSGACIPG